MDRRVTILYGALAADAPADEQDVLHEVHAVSQALQQRGWQVATLPLTLNLEAARAHLRALRPQCVFNLVESVEGQGQLIALGPMLLEQLAIPYTGAHLDAMYATSNKTLCKRILAADGVACPSDAPRGSAPWIVKSVWEHASIGLDDAAIVHSVEQGGRRIAEQQQRFGGQWFAEQFIAGREFNAALLESEDGVQVLPLAEICFEDFPEGKPRIVGYRAKWEAESFEYQHTPRRFLREHSEAELAGELRRVARRCWDIFALRGYARVDFRLDTHGNLWVLEVNANPCLSPDAGFAAALARAGIDYAAAVERIVAAAMRR
jgi:D-alanine-D-alanine ligase